MLRPGLLTTIAKVAFFTSIALIAVGSLLPSGDGPQLPTSDKLIHFLAYGFAGVLGCIAFRNAAQRVRCFLLLVCVGVSLEIGQLFVPGRAFEVWDMLANGTGAAVMFAASRFSTT